MRSPPTRRRRALAKRAAGIPPKQRPTKYKTIATRLSGLEFSPPDDDLEWFAAHPEQRHRLRWRQPHDELYSEGNAIVVWHARPGILISVAFGVPDADQFVLMDVGQAAAGPLFDWARRIGQHAGCSLREVLESVVQREGVWHGRR